MSTDLRVAIVPAPAADQSRARDFYRDKLGFKLVAE